MQGASGKGQGARVKVQHARSITQGAMGKISPKNANSFFVLIKDLRGSIPGILKGLLSLAPCPHICLIK